MWYYSRRKDPTQLSSDELKNIEVDDTVRDVNALMKKSAIPKEFGTEPFSKACPRDEVNTFLKYPLPARIGFGVCCYFPVKLAF
jgi:hypothetical protein